MCQPNLWAGVGQTPAGIDRKRVWFREGLGPAPPNLLEQRIGFGGHSAHIPQNWAGNRHQRWGGSLGPASAPDGSWQSALRLARRWMRVASLPQTSSSARQRRARIGRVLVIRRANSTRAGRFGRILDRDRPSLMALPPCFGQHRVKVGPEFAHIGHCVVEVLQPMHRTRPKTTLGRELRGSWKKPRSFRPKCARRKAILMWWSGSLSHARRDVFNMLGPICGEPILDRARQPLAIIVPGSDSLMRNQDRWESGLAHDPGGNSSTTTSGWR